jgi:DNA gyrase subunit A
VTVFSTRGKEKVVSVEHIEGEDEGDDLPEAGDGDAAEGGEA